MSETQCEARPANKEYPCPCCGYMSFEEPPGSYDICEICFWEDDAVQLRHPCAGGANAPLVFCQQEFAKAGACTEDMVEHVRKPTEADVRDPEWRMLTDEEIERDSSPPDGIDYFNAVCKESNTPYYWRNPEAGEKGGA